jgi:hypothetical protein
MAENMSPEEAQQLLNLLKHYEAWPTGYEADGIMVADWEFDYSPFFHSRPRPSYRREWTARRRTGPQDTWIILTAEEI